MAHTNLVARFFVSVWYCYAVLIGITAHFYDFRTNRLRQSRILYYYSVFINVLMLLFVPVYVVEGVHYFDWLPTRKPVLLIVCGFNIISQAAMIFYVTIMRYWTDKAYCSIIEKLQALDDEWAVNQDSSYMWLFYLRFLTMCCQNMNVVFSAVNVVAPHAVTWLEVLLNLYFLTLWNFLHSTIFCYFLVLLHICRCFKLLNERLKCYFYNATETCSMQLNVAHTLSIHRKLQQLLLELTALFNLHIIALLLTFMVSNINIGYMAFMFFTTLNLSSFPVLFSISMFFIKLFDIYLLTHCCEETVAQHDEGAYLLRGWQQHTLLCGEYDKLCEEFSLWHTILGLKINICGMFNLDRRAAFGILAETILHSIIVMQFDYLLK